MTFDAAEPGTQPHRELSATSADKRAGYPLPPGAGTPMLAALAYAAAGWAVLPVHTPTPAGTCSCCSGACRKPGKHPRTRRGLLDATTDVSVIARWWKRWPDANVGVRTGALVVVDVDGREGAHALATLEADHARLPSTRRAATAQGQHIYFWADAQEISCSAGQLGLGLDVRGRGGYVVAPPSRHASGRRYSWTETHDVAPIPGWLASLLIDAEPEHKRRPLPRAVVHATDERSRRYLQSAIDGEVGDVVRAPAGTRNTTLNRAAFRLGQLCGAGLGDHSSIAETLLEAALQVGLGVTEALATIESGMRAGETHPRCL